MIKVSTTEEGLVLGLTKTHRLDLTNAGQLEKKVLKKKTRRINTVLINLEGIQFIDTAGFSILLKIQGGIEKKGLRFCIINVSDEVKELIHLLKLDQVLNCAEDHSGITAGMVN